jgi:hypothetical protein
MINEGIDTRAFAMFGDDVTHGVLLEWQAVLVKLNRPINKAELLSYQYPRDLPNLTKDKTKDFTWDKVKLELFHTEYRETVDGFEKVDDVYLRRHGKFAVCEDGTVLKFD